MNITEVEVDLAGDGEVLAYCTIVLDDCLAIHDLKVLDLGGGAFVSMPSRKVQKRCDQFIDGRRCQMKNALTSNYCNRCGGPLRPEIGRYVDTSHPITNEFREYLTREVLAAYRRESKSVMESTTKEQDHDLRAVRGDVKIIRLAIFTERSSPSTLASSLISWGRLSEASSHSFLH